jgi:hypothetical protein
VNTVKKIGTGLVTLAIVGALAGCQAKYEDTARATAAAQNAETAAMRAEAAAQRAEQAVARVEAAAQRAEAVVTKIENEQAAPRARRR